MKIRFALGVDGGGTKSDAVLVDEIGNVLGWGRGGTGQSHWAGSKGALESYATAVQGALGDRRPANLWVAGLYWPYLERIGISIPFSRYVNASEVERGLAAGLETHGIVVLSGTGSFVAGLTENGKCLTLDGLGPVLGDYGSGYQIGLAGMRAAMASSWGPKRKTILENLIPEALGARNTEEVFRMVYFEEFGRSKTASVAKVVARAAEQGDTIARKIILQAADDISEVASDVIRQLGLEESNCAIVASGGVAQGCAMYWNRVVERVLEIAPNLRPVCPVFKPCIGAALLALKAMGVPWTPELVERIKETQQAFIPSEDR
ncbi:MAG: BadF/BadG/BcrA/BcrD ATPase family protein [Armatimonadota bacterium]|nr:BadF/BadG/BcrA/BcrD ATPase family protein [Armatimonadota bacterium]